MQCDWTSFTANVMRLSIQLVSRRITLRPAGRSCLIISIIIINWSKNRLPSDVRGGAARWIKGQEEATGIRTHQPRDKQQEEPAGRQHPTESSLPSPTVLLTTVIFGLR